MNTVITINGNEYHQIPSFPDYYISKEAIIFKKLSDGTLKSIKKSQNSISNPMTNYEVVSFYIDKNLTPKGKKVGVHQVMAETFLPKTEGKNVVNHIDGNKQNNHITNLELCTQQENIQHAWATNLSSSEYCEKSVHKYSLHGKYLDTYQSLAKAAELTNVPAQNISKCANGLRSSAGGYIWDFEKTDKLVLRKRRKQYIYTVEGPNNTVTEMTSTAEISTAYDLPSLSHKFKRSDKIDFKGYIITRKEIS